MRKLAFLALFVAISVTTYAQSISFSLVTPPCNNDGLLTINMTGLTPPITVYWYTTGTTAATIIHTVTGTTTDALTTYSGGPLSVYATDGTNNAYNSYGGMPPFTYNLAATPESCPVMGSMSATITSGGTAPFTYQWYNTATSAIVGSGNPINLPTGNYGVIITDAAGCTYGSRYTYDSMNYIAYIAPYTISVNATPANCTNGTASVTSISGGAALPVTYLWSNGATTSSITGLTTGFYNVNVTDALGCVAAIDSSSVYVPQSVTITVPITPVPATCTDTNGAMIAFGSGGTPPYSYLWSNGATTESITGLGAGYYSVNVTDANGCIGSGSGYVGTSTPITVTYTANPSLCTSPSGNATISPSGGTLPYTILWYTTPPQTGLTATALSAGNYSFKVTDAVGCLQTGTVTVPPIDIISLSFTSNPALCMLSNGSMTVTPTGGVTPYTYSWNTGATTASITGASSGTYILTVTDNLGCSVTKYPYLPDYSPMSLGLTSTPSSCIFANDGTIAATPMGGTPPYTYGWSSGATTGTITGLPYGPYWVNVSDATGCTASDYTYLPYAAGTDCYCTIAGTVYCDTNHNCIQDPGETGIPNVQIYCSGMGYTYTDAAGHYSILVPTGTYTVSETVLAFYPLSPCQSNNIVVSTTAATGCVDSINFANVMDTIHDMHISTWDYSKAIPGSTYSQITLISNDGTVPESSVLSVYNPDGQLFAPSISPSGIFSGSPYVYNTAGTFPTINPGETDVFFMNYSVPTNIPLYTVVVFRDSVAYTGPMSNWLSDYSPWDNVNYYRTAIGISHDPNFKEVLPQGVGPTGLITYADSTLEYMVHFQNTGSAPAQNIIVIDTLDNNLDWTSMRPEYMSAACKVTLKQYGAYKVAKFTFNNIYLPTKASDPTHSNGMFTYTIKTNSGLPLGTQFRNRASIYFDYNAPVMTNSTLNTLGESTTAANNIPTAGKTNSFNIYPNPANMSFYAQINSAAATSAAMNICDVTGKTLLSKTVALQQGAQTISTDVSMLAPGMYFVNLNENGQIQTAKLVIMK